MSPSLLRSPLFLLALLALACSGDDRRTQWYYTCGDPVCRGYQPPPGVPACTLEGQGEACTLEDQRCDPIDACNRVLVCAREDPTRQGCPISQRGAKRDIRYLTTEDLEGHARALRGIRLATYRYRGEDPGARARLGFVIEDGPPETCVDAAAGSVDLYGYTSLAVAALQAQARELEELRRELAALRRQVERRR